MFGPILRRLFFRRLLRRVVRILLCAAFINADAVSNSNTVIKAFLETDAGPDDGAPDVVHAFRPAERRADDRGAFLQTVFRTYGCADRSTVTCAIAASICDALGAAYTNTVARAFDEPDAAALV